MRTVISQLKRWAHDGEDLAQRTLAAVGASQSSARINADAQAYWGEPDGRNWRSNSHWRDAFPDDLWSRMGEEHLAMFDRGARAVNFTRPWGRVVDWGCGGGANAVHFAPRAKEYVGVDISEDTLRECGEQLASCDTNYRPVVVDVADPEKV